MPQSSLETGTEVFNPTEFRLLFAPLQHPGSSEVLIEIVQPADVVADAEHAYMQYLVWACQAASNWLAARCRRDKERSTKTTTQQQFSQIVHASLELRPTAFAIANEVRRELDCDRVSVAVCRGASSTIEAVSGQDSSDRRSTVLKALSKLVDVVVACGEPLWFFGRSDDLFPQVQTVLDAYREESQSRCVIVLPLERPRPGSQNIDDRDHDRGDTRHGIEAGPLGALVIEQFRETLVRDEIAPGLAALQVSASQALGNALEHESLFLLPLWRLLGRGWRQVRGRHRVQALAAVVSTTVAGLALVFVPAELKLPARGTLEPVRLQNIYAAEDGIVAKLRVQSGDWVEAGAALAELENRELQAVFENLRGERATTSEQLRAVRIQRLRATGAPAADRIHLAGEEERLEAQLASLEAEYAVVEQQLASLCIRSPIAGRVATWDVEQLLKDRPVKSGQLLLCVYDPTQGWQLELSLADRRVGHLTRALRQGPTAEPLEVSYVLSAAPGARHTGHVERVQTVTELDAEEGHSVRIQVAIDRSEHDADRKSLKPGTSVIGEVHCGTCSLGYVWLHEVMETAQRLWFKTF
jgi:multidrug efflux pump subunit AcrA (membrane-fusion protein)